MSNSAALDLINELRQWIAYTNEAAELSPNIDCKQAWKGDAMEITEILDRHEKYLQGE